MDTLYVICSMSWCQILVRCVTSCNMAIQSNISQYIKDDTIWSIFQLYPSFWQSHYIWYKSTTKKPGVLPTTFYPWTYDGIFLGYQNTMHNIWHWDVCTSITKTVTNNLKDELQYRNTPDNQSPAFKHLIQVCFYWNSCPRIFILHETR